MKNPWQLKLRWYMNIHRKMCKLINISHCCDNWNLVYNIIHKIYTQLSCFPLLFRRYFHFWCLHATSLPIFFTTSLAEYEYEWTVCYQTITKLDKKKQQNKAKKEAIGTIFVVYFSCLCTSYVHPLHQWHTGNHHEPPDQCKHGNCACLPDGSNSPYEGCIRE